jgi:hypothetical protein
MNTIKSSKIYSDLELSALEFSNLSKSFQDISSSLSNLIIRSSLFANSIRSTSYSARQRNIGPISIFGGTPDRVLLLRHCREAQKQQRNLQIVFDALSKSRSTTLLYIDELSDLLKLENTTKQQINKDSSQFAISEAQMNHQMNHQMNQILINRRLSLLEQLKSKLIKDAAQSVEVLFASSALAIRLDVDIIDKESIEGDDNDQYHESLSPTCIWIRKLNQLKTLDENRSIETNTGNLNDSYNLDEEIALCEKVQQTLYTSPSITLKL